MKARLLDSYPIAPDVKHFVFDVPEVPALSYKAGQFVSFSHEIRGKKITRAYSTVSPQQGNRFELCLNLVHDGHFSPFLFAMRPGDQVDMKGPIGNFVWRTPVNDSILVGTGTGVAPFRAMLQEKLPDDTQRQFALVLGARYEPGLLYRADFEQMAAQHPNFRFVPTLSRPEPSWTGHSGYVQPRVLDLIGDRRDVDVYICGLKAMVDDLRQQLLALGFDKKQVIFEKYD